MPPGRKRTVQPTALCRGCDRAIVLPTGSQGAIVGLIGEAPDKWALKSNRPISAQNANALDIELGLAGLSINDMRITNLWGHELKVKPTGKKNPGLGAWERDYEANYIAALETVVKCKIVLLCGAGAIKAFLSEESENYIGLPTTSERLSGKIVIPAPTMTAYAFKPIGELRFCVQTLVKELVKL